MKQSGRDIRVCVRYSIVTAAAAAAGVERAGRHWCGWTAGKEQFSTFCCPSDVSFDCREFGWPQYQVV